MRAERPVAVPNAASAPCWGEGRAGRSPAGQDGGCAERGFLVGGETGMRDGDRGGRGGGQSCSPLSLWCPLGWGAGVDGRSLARAAERSKGSLPQVPGPTAVRLISRRARHSGGKGRATLGPAAALRSSGGRLEESGSQPLVSPAGRKGRAESPSHWVALSPRPPRPDSGPARVSLEGEACPSSAPADHPPVLPAQGSLSLALRGRCSGLWEHSWPRRPWPA